MKRHPVLILAIAFSICAAPILRVKTAPVTQAQEPKSDFEECAVMLIEFTQKHPNPTLTDRIEGYYLVAQCQEKMGQTDEAMISYAKAVTVGWELGERAIAPKAEQRLEKLYRAMHNDTLFGIYKIYKKAEESLTEPER